MSKLNVRQLEALGEAKSLLGSTWKSKIREAWFTGTYPSKVSHISHFLQQVRNTEPMAMENFK